MDRFPDMVSCLSVCFFTMRVHDVTVDWIDLVANKSSHLTCYFMSKGFIEFFNFFFHVILRMVLVLDGIHLGFLFSHVCLKVSTLLVDLCADIVHLPSSLFRSDATQTSILFICPSVFLELFECLHYFLFGPNLFCSNDLTLGSIFMLNAFTNGPMLRI